jgi:hypothetical protein
VIASPESKPVKMARDAGGCRGPKRSTRKRQVPVKRGRGAGAVGAETLERPLADHPTGLSANAIAQQLGAGRVAVAMARRLCERFSAAADVTRGHSPELEVRGSGRHDRVLSGELAQ